MSRVLPILFNTDMVRAILGGRKTVTRRVIKPQPKMRLCYTYAAGRKSDIGKWRYPDEKSWKVWGEEFRRPDGIEFTEEDEGKRWTPPYHTDDILYVRETWAEWEGGYLYRAWPKGIHQPGTWSGMFWRPSIHMPKEAARIWLKVAAIRVERLQDITEEQAKAEGFSCRNEFIKTFLRMYPDCTEESWLWAIEFERCEKPENI